MELQQLRLFIAAADTGSFTRGAERAFVSQPALSASISKLENELGTRLFVRNKRQVVLTPAGRKLLKRAKSIVGECAKAREELRQHDVQRHLRLGVINTLSIVWVARLIEQYRQANPDLQLDVIDASEEDMVRLQRDGHVDLALTVLGVVPNATATITLPVGLEMRELFREPYVVAMLPECHLRMTLWSPNLATASRQWDFYLHAWWKRCRWTRSLSRSRWRSSSRTGL